MTNPRPNAAAETRRPSSVRVRAVDERVVSSADLTGKTALVTGATSGLGRATATALARRGARVVLGCRDVAAAEKVATAIRAETGVASDDLVVVGPRLDLASDDSVRSFAREFTSEHPRLHLLVNNAGTNFLKRAFTKSGVGVIAQINFLGPAALTRALEAPILAAAAEGREKGGAGAGANVVHVSSVTHRYASVASVPKFLRDWDVGSYAATKLANVMFAYEIARRWGKRGVASSAVDPGAVYSSLWNNDAFFSARPMKAILSFAYAPPEDGAVAVVMASLAPFARTGAAGGGSGEKEANGDRDRDRRRNGNRNRKTDAAAHDAAADADDDDDARTRFYARGLFASSFISALAPGGSPAEDGPGVAGALARAAWSVKFGLWGAGALACSLLDYPLRRLSGGRVASATREVKSSAMSYDAAIASELWDEAGKVAGVRGG